MDNWIDVAASALSLDGWLALGPQLGTVVQGTRTLYLSAGSYVLHRDATLPPDITLVFERGAIVSGAVRLAVEGALVAGRQKIFDPDTLVVELSGVQNPVVFPQWWGALGDGRSDDGGAVAGMFAALGGAVGRSVVFPPGDYLIGRRVDIGVGAGLSVRGERARIVRGAGLFFGVPLFAVSSGVESGTAVLTLDDLTFQGRGGGTLLSLAGGTWRAALRRCVFARAATAIEVRDGVELWASGCEAQSCSVAVDFQGNGRSLLFDDLLATSTTAETMISVRSLASGVRRLGGPRNAMLVAMDGGCLDGTLEVEAAEPSVFLATGTEARAVALTLAQGCALISRTSIHRQTPGHGLTLEGVRRGLIHEVQVTLEGDGSTALGAHVRFDKEAHASVMFSSCEIDGASPHGRLALAAVGLDAEGPHAGDVHLSGCHLLGDFSFGLMSSGGTASVADSTVRVTGGTFLLKRRPSGFAPRLGVHRLYRGYRPGPSGTPDANSLYMKFLDVSGGTRFEVTHVGVVLPTAFNGLEVTGGTIGDVLTFGGRLLLGAALAPVAPIATREGEPMPALHGDVFRPRGFLNVADQYVVGPATQWWCHTSAVGEAGRNTGASIFGPEITNYLYIFDIWGPICSLIPQKIDDGPARLPTEADPPKQPTGGTVEGSESATWIGHEIAKAYRFFRDLLG